MTQPHYIGQLKSIAKKISEVEERHNEVVDVYADITSKRKEVGEEIRAHTEVLRREFRVLQEVLAVREKRVRKATLILSLLAQQEEVSPVRNRIDKQPYEQYATTKWFLQELREQL